MRRRRVLLGWELGEHRGHVLRLRDIAVRLRRRGVAIAWAALRLDQLEGIAEPGEPVFQSPLWPGLHLEAALARAADRPHLSHADLLGDLGLDTPGAFGHLLAGWDAILAASRPDAVFADFAPALIAACRGRAPVVAGGIGFALPPADLPRFPAYPHRPGQARADPEPVLLEHANRGLARSGRPAISALPQLYKADITLVSAFRELDPYAEHRTDAIIPPSLLDWAPPVPGSGEGVVAYWSERLLNQAGFFEALARLDVPATVVVPGLRPEHAARYARPHLRLQPQPLSFAEIARARLVVSNGSTGFVSAAMLAGVPQAILPHDLQKELVGEAVERLGVGFSRPLGGVDWEEWRARFASLYTDLGVRDRAVRLASRLIPRMHAAPADTAAEALLTQAGRGAPDVVPFPRPRVDRADTA